MAKQYLGGSGPYSKSTQRVGPSGSDTGGDASRPNMTPSIVATLMVQDKATKRMIPYPYDSTGGTGITVTLAGGNFRDAEGTPANVAAAAATGTSIFAARRDHVHTIAAGVVTGTMIAATTVTNSNIANSTIDLTTKVTGVLPPLNGGTGAALVPAVGDILYASSSTVFARLADVAAGSYLRSGGVTTAPVWSTATLPNTVTIGDMLAATGTNVIGVIGAGTLNNVLVSNGAGSVAQWGSITLSSAAAVSGTLLIANGGTNSSTALAGGRPVISNATKIVESSGYQTIAHAQSPYTVVVGDCESIIGADASGGTCNIALPALASTNLGFRITVINVGASGIPTVTPNGTDNIDGNNVAHSLNAKYSKMTLRSTGSNTVGWLVESAEDFLTTGLQTLTTQTFNTAANIGSVSLTPGEWDFHGMTAYISGGTTPTAIGCSIGITSAVLGTNWGDTAAIINEAALQVDCTATIAGVRVSQTAASTPYYLVGQVNASAGANISFQGRMFARRVR